MKDSKVYKPEVIDKYMKIQVDIPDYLNKMLKLKKIRDDKRFISEVIIDILDKFYRDNCDDQ